MSRHPPIAGLDSIVVSLAQAWALNQTLHKTTKPSSSWFSHSVKMGLWVMRDMWWWFFSLWSYGVRSFFLEFRLLPLWAVLWFFKETAGSRYLQRITTRELAGSGYLKKIRIRGMPGLGISKSWRTAGFHERATGFLLVLYRLELWWVFHILVSTGYMHI